MKLFLFSRYISAHRDDGFAVIAARSKEEAEKILADKFYPENPSIVLNHCVLMAIIPSFPQKSGLICSDEPLIRSDFAPEDK